MCCSLFMVHYNMTQDEILILKNQEWTDNCFNHRDVDFAALFWKKHFF